VPALQHSDSRTEPDAEPASGYGSAHWSALGSYVHLVVADGERLEAARAGVVAVLDAVDRSCSRFRDDSDLVRANRAAGRWVRVDRLLTDALAVAVAAAAETDGLVDPTLGAHLAALGYDRDLSMVRSLSGPAGEPRADRKGPGGPPPDRSRSGRGGPDESGPAAIPALPVPNAWRELGIDPDGAVYVPPGVALDLGATGKAFAADLIARSVPKEAGTDLVISLGGDVAVGLIQDPDLDWPVIVTEQVEDADGDAAETVMISSGGLATSSVTRRRWKYGGRVMHHLLDPRTGAPVSRVWRTATVSGASCVAANTASTVSIVLGEQAPAWLAERDLAARLVAVDGTVVRVGGWPEGGP